MNKNSKEFCVAPKNLGVAIQRIIDYIAANHDIIEFYEMEEEPFSIKLFNELKDVMLKKWGLLKRKGKLFEFFVENAIDNPEDMMESILVCTWRKMHVKPFDIPAQAEKYAKYWKAEQLKLEYE